MKKKLIGTCLCLAMALSVTACGYDDTSTDITKIDCKKYVTEIGEYEGLVAYADVEEVTDDTVEDYLEYMMYNSQELFVVDRAAQNGDTVNIDYVGKKDDVAFDGGTAAGYDLELGSGRFIPGFEDGLIGTKAGDVVDLELTFPENYSNSELAGQAVVFTVTVNEVKEYQVPELNDEYVQSLYIENCYTVDDFKKVAKEKLESTAQYNYEDEIESQVKRQFFNNCTFSEDVPTNLYDYYHNMILENDETQSKSANMELPAFVAAYYGIADMDTYYEQVEKGAKDSVHQAMAAYLLAKKLGLTVSDKELQESIEAHYADFKFTSADDFRKYMNVEDYRAYLMEEKIVDYLREHAVVYPTSEKPVEAPITEEVEE